MVWTWLAKTDPYKYGRYARVLHIMDVPNEESAFVHSRILKNDVRYKTRQELLVLLSIERRKNLELQSEIAELKNSLQVREDPMECE